MYYYMKTQFIKKVVVNRNLKIKSLRNYHIL